MFPPVLIDISEVASEFILSDEETKSMSKYILARVSDEFVRQWDHQVDQNLHSTRNEYRKGMFLDQTDDYTVVIGLTPRQSKLSMMLEDGASAFDIKQGFSQSDKRKIGKNGKWYLTVPFRWATSEAVAEAGFSNQMTKPLEKLVKVSKTPIKLDNLPKELQGLGQNKTSGYTHKFTIYEGLQRMEIGSGQNEKRGGYMSFRRVSENSDKSSWMHPGFEALDLMGKASQDVDIAKVVDMAVQEFLDENR